MSDLRNKIESGNYTPDDILDWYDLNATNENVKLLQNQPRENFESIEEYEEEGIIYTIGTDDGISVILDQKKKPEIFGVGLTEAQIGGLKVKQNLSTAGDILSKTPKFLGGAANPINFAKGLNKGVVNAFGLVDNLTGGAVTKLDNYLVENFPNTLGKKFEYEKPQGAGGMTGEIIGQYVLTDLLLRRAFPFFNKNMATGLAADATTVGLFSSADEGNLADLISMFVPESEDPGAIAKVISSLQPDADDSEIEGRLKNVMIDTGALGAVLSLFKIGKGLFSNPEAADELVKAQSAGAAATPKEAPTPVEVVDSSGQPIKQVDQTDELVTSEKPFYSNVEKTISNFTFKQQPGNQILATLNNTAGIKQSEIQDLGLDTFLKDKPNVSKEELDDFIANKSLTTRVNEEILDTQGKEQLDFYIGDDAPELIKNASSKEEAYELFMNELDDPPLEREFAKYKQDEINAGNIVNNIEHFTNFMGDKFGMMDVKQNMIPTKYDDFVTPGGSRYKEILITVPGTPRVFTKHHYQGVVPRGENLIAHARFNERTIDNKKILFVEEIQSDLHQAGRKQGYSSLNLDVEVENINSQLSLLSKAMDETKAKFDPDKTQEYMDQYNKLLEKRQSLVDEFRNTVADAPFKNNWHELTMKRLIKYAIDNGFDGISFTTGKMQNDRYDLAKKITALRAEKIIGGTKDGQYDLTITPIFGEQKSLVVKESDLERYVGKDLSTKIIEDAPKYTDGRNYTGLDLEFGGSGMKGFYDKILPSYLSKFGKKFGANLEKTELDLPAKTKFDMRDLRDFEYNKVYDAVGTSGRYASYKIRQNFDNTPEKRIEVIQIKDGKELVIHRSFRLGEAKGVLLEELDGFKVPQIIENREAPQVPIMFFPQNMKNEILTEGVPIAQVEERENKQQTTAVV